MSEQSPLPNNSRQLPPTSELLALEELRSRGVEKLCDHPIDTLIKIARRRQEALKLLQEAEEELHRSTDEGQILINLKEVLGKLKEILSELKNTKEKYPNTPDFDLRRIEVKSDIMRAQRLRSICRNRVEAQGMKLVADFYAKVHMGDKKSLADAHSVQEKIKTLAGEYPDIFPSDMLNTLNKALEAAKTHYLDVRMKHIRYFLEQASVYQDTHPLAAMDCLAHSQEILDKLQQELKQVNSVSDTIRQRVQKIKDQIYSQKEKTTTSLPQWLTEQQKNRFDSLQEDVKRNLDNSDFSNTPVSILDDVKYGEGIRRKLDEIYFLLLSMGRTDIPRWLQTLLRIRQNRLLQADLLYRQAEEVEDMDNQSQIQAGLVYWAWSRVQQAYKYNPDSKEIKDLYERIKKRWENTNEQFNKFIKQAGNSFDELQDRIEDRDRFRRKTENENLSNPSELLEKAKQSLEKAQEMLDKQVEKPVKWQNKIQKVNMQYEKLRSFAEKNNILVKTWEEHKTKNLKLLEETEKFLNTTEVPDIFKRHLRQAVKNTIENPGVGTFEKPSLALSACKIVADTE